MLATGTRDLARAHAEGWAIPGFSVYNLEQALAVCRAAEAEGTPAIVQAGSSAFGYAGEGPLAALAVAAATASPARIGVHLDHATDLDEIGRCLRAGYSSVMYDGSALPLEENVRRTGEVVRMAAEHGAWVEAELAGFAGDEDRTTDAQATALTDPEVAAGFVAATGVDALAIAIGNVHGIPTRPVQLDFDRLAAIRERVEVPLVLHGASGLPDGDVARAIGLGVAKINVNTELRRAFRDAWRRTAAAPPDGDALPPILEPAIRAVEDVARAKLRAFARATTGARA
ncbi:class II fructose-bisphosphate aldolase [Patulibacter defluvii]|uniref:class II fructose-bisphosphate aldolase n=1 Tax=Patulibacter defluvii TaxID=3095358 RepID=UPI002A762229|nr:class II fructose-bisphosphate aldolase [Patulibacter sp. DM4]